MRNYLKGLLSGVLLVAVLFSVPAFAENVWALFNTVRININGIDKVQQNENYQLNNGSEVPYSIVYGDTTYLPMRKMSELFSKTIYWNGDSMTVSMTEQQTGNSQKTIAKKPDKNGNEWTYYIFATKDNRKYLGVKDEARGFERVYRLGGSENADISDLVFATEDAIYFLKMPEEVSYDKVKKADSLYKIAFDNDADTQDGAEVEIPWKNKDTEMYYYGKRSLSILSQPYLFFTFDMTMSTNAHSVLYAVNIFTGESVGIRTDDNSGSVHCIISLDNVEANNGIRTVYFKQSTTSPTLNCAIEFYDNGELKFGEVSQLSQTDNP